MAHQWQTYEASPKRFWHYTDYQNGFLIIRETILLDDFSTGWCLLQSEIRPGEVLSGLDLSRRKLLRDPDFDKVKAEAEVLLGAYA